MLTPKTLTLSGIGRFVEKQTINFDDMGQLVQIDGENRNTGGSSGSGKTTLFNAHEYNLGLNDLPVTVLQSRLTKDGIYTEGVYDWDGKEVVIVRGKGKFSITVEGNLVEGSAKLVEEKIDEILGMSRDLFRPIFHKRQKEGGFFLAMTPSKTHEFLTNVLNLGAYAKKLELVDKDIKDLGVKKERTLLDINGARSGLLATSDAILALGLAPVRDMHQNVVIELKNKSDASATILGAVQAAHKDQNTTLDAQRPSMLAIPSIVAPELDTTPFPRSTMDLAAAKRQATEKQISDLLEKERHRQQTVKASITEKQMNVQTLKYKITLANTAKTEAQKLAGEIKTIRECVCPTCQQQWIADAAKAKEAELIAKLTSYRAQIADGAQAESGLITLDQEVAQLTIELSPFYDPQLPDLNADIANQSEIILAEKAKMDAHQASQAAENAQRMSAFRAEQAKVQGEVESKNKAAADEFAFKQQAVRHQQTLELDQARGQADIDRRAFDAAANKLKAFEEANARYTSSHSQLKAQEQQYNQKLVDMDQILVNTEVQLVIAEETKRAIKSFMSCSFDEALDEIGDAATRIIRAIPNMANATVQFQGVRETQSGKIKEEVNAVISMDGEEGIDIRSLSGGERSSADLAIDLAVIDLIENRSNKGISIFILDEPFTGLDTVSVEMVLEVLKNAKINKKLIIVDHNPEVKQMVESRIVAVRDGLISTIVQ